MDCMTETDHLALKDREKIEQFDYEIKNGGGIIVIRFKDGEFESAHYPFKAAYSRDHWRILSEIEKIITEIENAKKQL